MFRLTTPDGTLLSANVEMAKDPIARFRGLMLRQTFPQGSALVLEPCSSIHMFFMRFAIDVAFVTRDGYIKHALHTIRPWRMSRIVFGAQAAIELPAGTLKQYGLDTGSKIVLQEILDEKQS